MTPQPTRERDPRFQYEHIYGSYAEFVNLCNGRPIVGMEEEYRIGDSYEVRIPPHVCWGGERLVVIETITRIASRDEWLACPWPSKDLGRAGFFYEVTYD